MLLFKFRQSSLFVLSHSPENTEIKCARRNYLPLYIWIFSIASKIQPFVALIAPSSANSRILIYCNVMSHPSEKLATSCLSARVGQCHRQNNEAHETNTISPFHFPHCLFFPSFSFSLALGHVLIPFSKSKGFFLSVWLVKGYQIVLKCYRAQPSDLGYFQVSSVFSFLYHRNPFHVAPRLFHTSRLKSVFPPRHGRNITCILNSTLRANQDFF